jgi:ATP-dependent DNA helicase 2 subunit 2
MSKEAIIFCIDVSASMGVIPPGKSQTRLQETMEGVKLLIEAKILQSKQNEVGVVLFGTDDTSNPLASDGVGYQNVNLMAPLASPRVSLLSELDAIKMGQPTADIIDGLVVAVDHMHRKIGNKKFTKSVYLITAAENMIENPGDLESLVTLPNF